MTRPEAVGEIHDAMNAVSRVARDLPRAAAALHFKRDEEAVDRLGIIIEQLESARCWIRRAHASADRQFKEGASWTISGRRKHSD